MPLDLCKDIYESASALQIVIMDQSGGQSQFATYAECQLLSNEGEING